VLFGRKKNTEAKKEAYRRVYELHQQAVFLCYIDDAYMEDNQGTSCVKLEGLVAKGTGTVQDTYLLYDCNGRQKAVITMEELYVGNQQVKQLAGGDKRVALYPVEQQVCYRAGDLLCIMEQKKGEEYATDYQ
jgi:hypothetical protein